MKDYKPTKAVLNIRENLDKYIARMKAVGKVPSCLYLRTDDYNKMLEDQNKYFRSIESKERAKSVKHNGFEVKIYSANRS